MVRETAAASTTGAGHLVNGQEDLRLRLPSLLWPGVELTRLQLTATRAELAHAHLAPAYLVRHGQGGIRPHAAHDG